MKLVLTAGDARPASREDNEARGRRGRRDLSSLYGIENPDEGTLLRVIGDGEGKRGDALYPAYFALQGLHGIATPQAVPVLKRAIYYPKQHIKTDAFSLIQDIAGTAEASFYLDTLRDPRYPYKGAPIWALGRWGRAEAIGDAVRRAKTVLRKDDRHLRASRFEIVCVVRLLARHPGDAQVQAFFDVLPSRWDRLKPHERWSIADLLRTAGVGGVWDDEPEAFPLGLHESIWDFGPESPREVRVGPRAL